jgi:hypothetical protein
VKNATQAAFNEPVRNATQAAFNEPVKNATQSSFADCGPANKTQSLQAQPTQPAQNATQPASLAEPTVKNASAPAASFQTPATNATKQAAFPTPAPANQTTTMSLAQAEAKLGELLKHHHKKHHNKHHHKHHEKEDVQVKDDDDLFNADENEDNEIMKSIAAAEKQLGTKMKTPTAFKEHPWSPLKYDVEEGLVQVDSQINSEPA